MRSIFESLYRNEERFLKRHETTMIIGWGQDKLRGREIKAEEGKK